MSAFSPHAAAASLSPSLCLSPSPSLPLSPHSTVAQWTAPTAISHHYHLPSWATASHYHAALLIFLSYQLANHKPLSLMARFGVRRYSFCRSNLACESFESPDDCRSLTVSVPFSRAPVHCSTGKDPSVSPHLLPLSPKHTLHLSFKSFTHTHRHCLCSNLKTF